MYIDNTGDWGMNVREFADVSMDLGSAAPGTHKLRFVVSAAGCNTNIDYFSFTSTGSEAAIGRRSVASNTTASAAWS